MPEKRIGGQWTHGDGGVPILAAQSSASAAIASNGQYTPLIVEENGGLKVNASVTIGANSSVNVNQIAGQAVATAATGILKVGLTDGSGNAITSSSSAIDINIQSTDIAIGGGTQYKMDTTTASATGNLGLGYDGSIIRALLTDSTGRQMIDISRVGGNTAATGAAGVLSVGINTNQNAINVTQIGGTTPATGGTGILSFNEQLLAGQAVATAGTGTQLVGANIHQVGGQTVVTASAGIQRMQSVSTVETRNIFASGLAKIPQYAIISASAAGTADVIASASSTSYIILAYNLMTNGSSTAQFFSNTTPLSGKIPMVTGGAGKVCPFSPAGWFMATAGHNVKISLSAAAEVTGEIVYIAV